MRRTILGGLALFIAVGCRSQSTPVRLQGDATSIASLAGSWAGQYWGGTGRGGSLAFSLRSGSDSLYGDVTMLDASGQQLRPADPMEVHRAHVNTGQSLRIDFVAVHADSVRGTIEPYISPECDCAASTTFVGQVRGGVITGTFVTRGSGRVRAQGSWEMKRVSDRVP
jgi:hypothetical protein